MYQELSTYLSYQGDHYIKPERAGALAPLMVELKDAGQEARKVFTSLSKALEERIRPFKMTRVSNWANQAQIARPHFWTYYRLPEDSEDDVALAIRLYGESDDFGVSVEVSFIERKKSESTLAKQARVLSVPIAEPFYYIVQVDGVSHREPGTEGNRQSLQEGLAAGQVRKVLVKTDIPITADLSQEGLLNQLVERVNLAMPYLQATKEAEH
ncbi:HI_0552 family protein [Streptococcus caprae]|uniref:HI_0552 family protein n=1 Tax=Streptococcus caprae TaxID=1640501 RepID=A0ABV8CWX3_9STRE